MAKEHIEELREAIRKILEKNNSMPKERVINEEIAGNREIQDWIRYEHFGWLVLRQVQYQGEFQSVLYAIKKILEESDGWLFDDSSEGIW